MQLLRSGRHFVDLLRAAAFVGALVTAVFGVWADALRFLGVGLVLLAVRPLTSPPAVQAAFSAAALFATVANVLEWYKYVNWIDTVIHALTTGTGAALAATALLSSLARTSQASSVVPARVRILFTAGVGAIGAILWEFYEWLYEQIEPHSMTVGYMDTLADLAAGLGGSTVAGLVVGWLLGRPVSDAP